MLQDAGCKYVILGHSERRCNHNENSSLIALKIASAVKQNLIPILCVGEDKSHRDSGKYAEFIKEQLKSSIPENLEIDNLIIAYEPIWSIGTGILPQISEIEEISRLIKEFVQNSKNINNFKVIYGGSVKKDNSSEVLSGNNIDGLLVGGASLDANEFFDICFNT
jgi:triosephosphate isomerase